MAESNDTAHDATPPGAPARPESATGSADVPRPVDSGHPQVVSRRIDVAAAPSTVFSLLADPRQHPLIDGSGTVQAVTKGPERLRLGSRFGMRMRFGLPYIIGNQVVEYDDDRLIAWRHFGRHVWRYELEPLPDGRTRVTESFDYSGAPARAYELLGFPARNARGIEETLPRLKDIGEAREQSRA